MSGPIMHGTTLEQAEIEHVLPVTEHERSGLVLALKEGFSGVIATNGVVQGKCGSSEYTGPTTVEDWDASGVCRTWTAVVAVAENAIQLFQPRDVVAFLPRRDPRAGCRAMTVIELDARGWTHVLDFYNALLPAIGAPAWHGGGINALVDSMIWGGINAVEPPYEVRIGSVQGLDADVRREVERARQALEEQGTDFCCQYGHGPGVSLKVTS